MEMAGPDTYGLPPRKMPGSILRKQVCVCVAVCLRAVCAGCLSSTFWRVVLAQDGATVSHQLRNARAAGQCIYSSAMIGPGCLRQGGNAS